jgi:acetyl-CoA carboxylase biotin carboxyl carrier protein
VSSAPGPAPEAPAALGAALDGDVRALLRAVRGTNVEEIRLAWGDVRIAVRRDLQTGGAASPAAPGAGQTAPLQVPEASPTDVRAHMVGPFHRSRRAEGPVLVSEGDVVEAGRALGVIETLGMATDVEAPAAGRVERFLVEDGQPVEYGQLLALIVAAD